MLVMDAFSGDSVPVHLITKEAFAHLLPPPQARRHPGGQHLQRYLNLEPVMERAANAFDKLALVYHWIPKTRPAVLLLLLDADHEPRDRATPIRT